MLKNAPTLAIVAVHTAENEPLKISLFHFISSILSLESVAEVERRTVLTTQLAIWKAFLSLPYEWNCRGSARFGNRPATVEYPYISLACFHENRLCGRSSDLGRLNPFFCLADEEGSLRGSTDSYIVLVDV